MVVLQIFLMLLLLMAFPVHLIIALLKVTSSHSCLTSLFYYFLNFPNFMLENTFEKLYDYPFFPEQKG